MSFGPQFQYSRFNSRLDATSPEFRSFRPGARETGIDPLSNNPPLKLSKYTQHLKHRFAGSRRSIEPLLMKEQADSLFMEALEYAEQVSERSTEAVH